ncbi:hypothetical protein [Dipodfec virus UOA04_Rod_781]|nr:hypothetical protein [Dipodfec virus UOA04_Rod_781]
MEFLIENLPYILLFVSNFIVFVLSFVRGRSSSSESKRVLTSLDVLLHRLLDNDDDKNNKKDKKD